MDDGSDVRAVVSILSLLALAGVSLTPFSPLTRLLGLELLSAALSVYVVPRWGRRAPYRGISKKRVVTVAIGLVLLFVVLPTPVLDGASLETDMMPGRIQGLVIACLAIPATAFSVLFFQGALYAALEKRGGSLWAIIGTIGAALLLALPLTGLRPMALLPAGASAAAHTGSRWMAGSVLPGLVAGFASALLGLWFVTVAILS